MNFSELTRSQITENQEEMRRLYKKRSSSVLLLTVVLFLFFSILDYILVPSLFLEFFQYRLVVSVFCLFLFFLNYRDADLHYTIIIGLGAYFFSLLALDLMVVRMGGVTSPYFAGFIIAIVFYNAMLPATMLQSLLSGSFAVLLYLFSILIWSPIGAGQGSLLLNNVFFIAAFVALVSIQSWYENKARREAFLLRLAEEEATEKLNEHAEALELEVARRTAEQKRTEKRFQLLFEHILDDVILVDEQGVLLYANAPFFDHVGIAQGERVNLLDLVGEGEWKRFQHDLLIPVSRGKVVSGFETRFLTAEDDYYEVEINGNLLKRKDKLTGLQLIIRDISVRKQMEQDLRKNLQLKKQTENATIMALARLSEYRDITPVNHLERMREYTRLLGEELSKRADWQNEIGVNTVADLTMASVLHDIGMVGISDTVLYETGELTAAQQEQIRQHTVFGGDVIKAMETADETSGFLKFAKSIAYFHHEKWDGSGYPFGFAAQDIPLPARIVALADAYEEMTCDRGEGGREKKSHQQAVKVIVEGSGQAFDPVIVDAFLAQEEEFDTIRQTMTSE